MGRGGRTGLSGRHLPCLMGRLVRRSREGRPRGSEDLMLVPDSEADIGIDVDQDEYRAQDEDEDEELPTMSFNMSQFAFLG